MARAAAIDYRSCRYTSAVVAAAASTRFHKATLSQTPVVVVVNVNVVCLYVLLLCCGVPFEGDLRFQFFMFSFSENVSSVFLFFFFFPIYFIACQH